MKISDFIINNNIASVLEKEVIISDRFVDEEGNILPFKIRNISSKELADIHRLIGENKHLADAHIVAKCCIEPNFKSVELQNHFNLLNDVDLIEKVLLVGEINKLSIAILKLSGYDKSFEGLVQEAKKH